MSDTNPNELDLSADKMYPLATSILWCAVCVPRAWATARIESEVNSTNPAGTSNGWVVGADAEDTDDCPDDPKRIHVRLWC